MTFEEICLIGVVVLGVFSVGCMYRLESTRKKKTWDHV